MLALQPVEDVIEDHTGNARTALEYSRIMKRLVDAAKEPGFSSASWAPLAELVAVDEFERMGNFKDLMRWDDYVGFLTGWATTSDWECSFKRITEQGNLVFLELEERLQMGDLTSAVNSLSVYEFDDAGKIRHLDIYLQMALPEGLLPESYEGVQISD
ncbi:MAG TPA: hypothetical protein VFI47_29580 [Acidimicrobiales bacterium]|nr:hypothetical protein [Acidimicrobiales bacterium]